MNRWNIPPHVEHEVLARDLDCAYCRSAFSEPDGPYRARPSWEHVINDLSLVAADNIVLCCVGCNASKGARPIEQWLSSKYCRERGITLDSVSATVRRVLERRAAVTGAAPNNSVKPTAAEVVECQVPHSYRGNSTTCP